MDKMMNKEFMVIAGPCTIESYQSLYDTAAALSKIGVKYLRGGAYKLRTSVHTFRGLGDSGIRHLAEVGKAFQMKTVSECTQIDKVDFMAQQIDILVVGTRNMHNYPLLERLGKISNPVILKRAISSTYDEWLAAAEYIIESGNPRVILCERGIRTFESHTRYTLDIAAVPVMQSLCGLPLIIDPSHAAGNSRLVPSLALSGVAAGANGLMIETHINPEESICDAAQTISPETLELILEQTNNIRRNIFIS